MAAENSLDSISDVSMDDDVTYMDYSLNNFSLTDNIPDSNDDIIMESYVLWQLRSPETTSAPKTDNTPSLQWAAPILIACVWTSIGLPKPKDCIVLLDSGASGSIVPNK